MPRALSRRDRRLLGLLALGSMPATFVNTLFTQTVAYAADEFDVTNTGQGFGAAVVRWGIFLSLPFVVLADKRGRRRVIVLLASIAPIVAALGAIAPSFPILVATQTVGRPLGIMLETLIVVVAIEELPRGARALGTAVIAVAGGAGAAVAVVSLPLADLGLRAWRLIYLVSLLWLVVAVALWRHLPETRRFTERSVGGVAGATGGRVEIRRLAINSTVAFITNIFIASASIFQNRYLKDERDYSALLVALFTAVTTTPSALSLIIGGRIADARGRRLLATTAVPVGAVLFASSFAVSGWPMWLLAIAGGVAFGAAYPAIAVYRGELFPTRRRGLAGGVITTSALVGGSLGLIVAGRMIDGGFGYGGAMFVLAAGPVIASVLVWLTYPETAQRELEEINPDDAIPVPGAAPTGR